MDENGIEHACMLYTTTVTTVDTQAGGPKPYLACLNELER